MRWRVESDLGFSEISSKRPIWLAVRTGRDGTGDHDQGRNVRHGQCIQPNGVNWACGRNHDASWPDIEDAGGHAQRCSRRMGARGLSQPLNYRWHEEERRIARRQGRAERSPCRCGRWNAHDQCTGCPQSGPGGWGPRLDQEGLRLPRCHLLLPVEWLWWGVHRHILHWLRYLGT